MKQKKISQTRRKNPEKLSSDIARMHVDNFTRYAIQNIVEVQARIHRIILNCPWDKKPIEKLDIYFKKIFNNVGQNPDRVPRKRMKGYKNQLISVNSICKIYIFIDRIDGILPVFRMEVVPRENTSPIEFRNYLAELDRLIENLHPTEVEYTLDLFCNLPREVESLFQMIKRSVYVPYKNNPKLFVNPPHASEQKRFNSTFNAADDVKIYERGYDETKEKYLHKSAEIKKGWSHENLNRVRLEQTVKRPKLTKHDIVTLSDLISDCRFHELNKDIYKFKSFMSKTLPNYWDWPSYSIANEQGHKGAFQFEYVLGRHLSTNVRQYMKDVEQFDLFKERLIQKMLDFDLSWTAAT